MCTNVLFIIPPAIPITDLEYSGKIKYGMYIPTSIPIGVLSISSYLNKLLDVNIKILDFNVILNSCERDNINFSDIVSDYITKNSDGFNPNVIGISALFNSNFSYLENISNIAKKAFPDSFIIAGGGLPTNLYKEVLRVAPNIDAVCFSEGEIPIYELLNSSDYKKHTNQDSSWITREKLLFDFKPEAKYVKDLDEIPPINYELLCFENYQKHSRYHGDDKNAVAVSLMTSRGCPFRCCFCASHSVHGREIRLTSATRVLEDIEILVNNYGVNTLLIEDDHFLIDKGRAIEILKGLKNKNLNIEFPNGVAVYAIDEEIADALNDAGVKMVTLAIESGSEYVLNEIIHKPLKLPMVGNAVSILRSRSIYIRAFFIVGFPGETEEYRKETYEFIKNTGFNWVAIMIATPIAGSELYEICVDNNYLTSTHIEDFYYGKANIKTDDFTPEEIENIRYLMNLDLNFINNYDMSHNNYEIALIGFKDVVKRVPTHAIAYYCLALCYEKLGMFEEQKKNMNQYLSIIESDEKWRGYAEYFNLL